VEPLWEVPAKLLRGFAGADGTLRAGPDRIVFDSAKASASRTWRYGDVSNISSAGPFEFTIVSLDGGARFQLKQILPEDRFNDLWRRINESQGLKTFQSQLENKHD
jgi:hypothetical protein